MGIEMSRQGHRVLEALCEDRRFRRRVGDWAAGPLVATDALVADLVRRGLLTVRGDTLAASAAGRAWARRQVESTKRLLAERARPEDGAPRTPEPRTRPARSVTVNLAESPLGWLKARGLVDARQYEAGERLRGDWTIAGLGPRVTMRWDAGARSTGAGLDPALAQIAAKRRTDAALDAVGPGLKDVLWRIVCAGEGMEAAERALGWPARAGRVVLTLALDRLADFYGLG